MQQFMQSEANLQHEFLERLLQRQDALAVVPLGTAWFDIIPVNVLVKSRKLAVVVYPNYHLIHQHIARLRQMGFQEKHYAVLTSNTAPHAERMIWERLKQADLPLLFITAQKFQAFQTLTQLVQFAHLGSVIVEQAHLAISHLWGPSSIQAYHTLAEFFHHQWQNRPALFLFSHPLSLQYRELLQTTFRLNSPAVSEVPLLFDNLTLQIQPVMTQYQKLRRITRQILASHSVTDPVRTIIVCHSLKHIELLDARLSKIAPVFAIHRHMLPDDKESKMMQALHENQSVILVESNALSELPFHIYSRIPLRIIHWQMPWSIEALLQHSLIGSGNNQFSQEVQVFYSKEDFLTMKSQIKNRLQDDAASKTIYMDQLQRVRYFCIQSPACRLLQMQNWLLGGNGNRPVCQRCDRCSDPHDASSLWMKLLHLILY